MTIEDRRRILVVDDEPQITRVLKASLTREGYDVRTANEVEAALDLFLAWHPHLIISDLSMPHLSGIDLCRKVRLTSQVPILVLSVKQEEETKVEALDCGADDYITKPFGMDEVLARVRAAIRRSSQLQAASKPQIELGDFTLDRESRQVRVRGKEVHLTPKEFDLLLYFLQNAGKVHTHKAVLLAVWGPGYVGQSESLRVYVAQLRKKIEIDPNSPRYLLTEHWVGYRFSPAP
jgi:two-component system KDP operon response regulator KdpE